MPYMEVMQFTHTLCPPQLGGCQNKSYIDSWLLPMWVWLSETISQWGPHNFMSIQYVTHMISVFRNHQFQVICWVTSTIYTQSLTKIPKPIIHIVLHLSPEILRRDRATLTNYWPVTQSRVNHRRRNWGGRGAISSSWPPVPWSSYVYTWMPTISNWCLPHHACCLFICHYTVKMKLLFSQKVCHFICEISDAEIATIGEWIMLKKIQNNSSKW